MKRFLAFVVLSALLVLLCGCEPSYTESQLEEEHLEGYEDGFDDGREKGYEDGYSDGKSDGYDEGIAAAAKDTANCVSDAIYAAGDYDELLSMVQSILDSDGEYTKEEAQEAINRLYYNFEALQSYVKKTRESGDPGHYTESWRWDEPYPGQP